MKSNRLQSIQKYVSQKDFVSIDELCEAFGKSKNTIRKDIGILVEEGALLKVYGGVKPVRAAKLRGGLLESFGDRNIKNVAAKSQISAIAARFVNDGDVIFIDSGTTVVNIVDNLRHLHGVTVLTNNLFVLVRCLDFPGITTISLGGQLNHSTASLSSNFCVLDNVQNFNINKAFMAVTGVSIEKGVTHASPEELAIKRRIMECSDTRFLLADHSKFDLSALLTYTDLATFEYIITDRQPPENYVDFFRQHGIRLVLE